MVAQIQYETGMPVVEKQSTHPLPQSRIDRGLESLMSGYTITGINDARQRYHSGSTYTSQIMPSLGSLRNEDKMSLASELGVIEKDLERKLSQFGEYSPDDVKTFERLKRLQLQFKGIVEASRKELESEREFLTLYEIGLIKANSQLRAYEGFDVTNNERYKKLASVKNLSEEIIETLRSSIAVKEHYVSQYEKVTRELSDFRYRKVLIVDNVKDKLMAVRYLKGRVNVAEEKKSVFSRIKEGYQNLKDKVQDYVPRFQIGGYSPIKVGTAAVLLLAATCAAKPAYNAVKSEPISGAKTIRQAIDEKYQERQDAAPKARSIPQATKPNVVIPTITKKKDELAGKITGVEKKVENAIHVPSKGPIFGIRYDVYDSNGNLKRYPIGDGGICGHACDIADYNSFPLRTPEDIGAKLGDTVVLSGIPFTTGTGTQTKKEEVERLIPVGKEIGPDGKETTQFQFRSSMEKREERFNTWVPSENVNLWTFKVEKNVGPQNRYNRGS
ncbi:MAG TPA: hypothetical protein VJI46_03160 [Candidatus Nanoarchaeia archaeon]|nr:hypothetical protein [Candidatus Nanoarchaeia archaeon]